ncbi:hypothetical protein [Gorillibacterium timonense]|uniref:hypothetical protein n=1 Tax=Gorillibacterium timonense TaxID=1689269 RepID=UPI00071E4BC5|nr:hypothetical protein [Gorillibacterium timonense]
MNDTGTTAAFIISCFCFAGVLILSKNKIQPPMRRYLAITAIVMIVIAFAFLIYLITQGAYF